MARPLRFAPADVPQHICCRGNLQHPIFSDEYDRLRYQRLLIHHAEEFAVRIIGYCQMTNHVHLVLQPSTDSGLSRMMARLNSEYAQRVLYNVGRPGRLWQGRFYAAPMDRSYLWTALRYVELNPVRAAMVRRPEDWPWSSASAHVGTCAWPDWLHRGTWEDAWGADAWASFLDSPVSADETGRIRQSTRQNRPLASAAVVRAWEINFGVGLSPKNPGMTRNNYATVGG